MWRNIQYVKCCGSIHPQIMDANLYTDILNQFLVPFVQTVYPYGYKFMQDNDPKHKSRHSKRFFELTGGLHLLKVQMQTLVA